MLVIVDCCFFFQAEDGIRDLVRSRGLGDVYKRQRITNSEERVVKIIKIEWSGGLTYCATFDPIIYKDHTFTDVYIHGEFQLV